MKGHKSLNSNWENPTKESLDKNLGTGMVRM